MTLVTQLRKMVGQSVQPCPTIPINLTGLEVGTPVSVGASAILTNGGVVAVGDGYEFVSGTLTLFTANECVISNYSTFTITGIGYAPTVEVQSSSVGPRYVVAILPGYGGGIFAAYSLGGWGVLNAPLPPGGSPYEIVVCIGPEFVRVWLNGISVGRATIPANYMGPEHNTPWQLAIGSYGGGYYPYTGKVTSVKWEIGALYPDVDNI